MPSCWQPLSPCNRDKHTGARNRKKADAVAPGHVLYQSGEASHCAQPCASQCTGMCNYSQVVPPQKPTPSCMVPAGYNTDGQQPLTLPKLKGPGSEPSAPNRATHQELVCSVAACQGCMNANQRIHWTTPTSSLPTGVGVCRGILPNPPLCPCPRQQSQQLLPCRGPQVSGTRRATTCKPSTATAPRAAPFKMSM